MKEKMLALLLEGTLFAVIARSMITGPNMADALMVLGILAAMSYKLFINKEKDVRVAAMQAEVSDIKNKIDLLTMKAGIVDARR